jgi:RNA polymerase sigma-70 factor (ECF subfamily)
MSEAVRPIRNDPHVLQDLATRYREVLRRYFERHRLTGADADDAVQEVFAKLARRANIVEIEKIEAYIFEIAANVMTDYFRRSISRRSNAHDEYDDSLHAGEDFSPERLYLGKEAVSQLIKALDELPERTRNIFILARLEHLTYPEISKRLSVSVSAVEKHMVKAIAHVTRRMGRRS